MMVFISNGKLHVSAYSGHLQVLTTLSLQEFYMYNMPKPRGDVEISMMMMISQHRRAV